MPWALTGVPMSLANKVRAERGDEYCVGQDGSILEHAEV
jgi:hypothetical protein